MSDAIKLARIRRLLSIQQTRCDAAEAAARVARMHAIRAQQVLDSAREHVETESARLLSESRVLAADLAASHAYLSTLRSHVNMCTADLETAEADLAARRADALRAQREVKKMELWEETTANRARVEQARKEQNASDELAAGITSRRMDER